MPQPQNIPEPTLITRPAQLVELGKVLRNEPLLAVDTESNSLHAYQEQVCLIQFSIPSGDYLVDPITLPEISALSPVFGDARVQKIFHAAEYDLICLKRDFGFRFENIFDTMVGARILGWKKFGLSSILEAQFGVSVNKKFQRADWGRRPLPREQLRYAQLDTHFLIPLRDRIQASLDKNGLWPLAAEDFRRATHVTAHPPVSKDELCFRVNGAHELEPDQMAVLQELCLYRDRVAAQLNRPLFKVISNKTLVAIAMDKPRSLPDLRNVFGVRDWLIRRYGSGILDSVARGIVSDPPKPPRRPRPSHQYVIRLEAMRSWRKNKARKMGVESDVILPRDVMEQIVQINPKNLPALDRVMGVLPWREKQFGAEILSVLKKVK